MLSVDTLAGEDRPWDSAEIVERRFQVFSAAIEQALDFMPGTSGFEAAPAMSPAERTGRWSYRTGRFNECLRLLRELDVVGFDLKRRRILDIGCGFGGHVAAFSMLDAYCVGLDLLDYDFRAIKAALTRDRLQSNVDFVVSDANALPFRARSFDLILSNKLLEHLTDEQIQSFLRTVRNLLDETGMAIIRVPVALRGIRNDPHYSLPLVSLLPARVKRFVSERMAGRKYPWSVHQTFLHPGKLRRLCTQESLSLQTRLFQTGRLYKLVSQLPLGRLWIGCLELICWDYIVISRKAR
jgi:SAM-dependent methyltransferase